MQRTPPHCAPLRIMEDEEMGALDAPITVRLHTSRALALALLLMAAGALAAIGLAQVALWIKLLLAAAVLADLRHRLRLHAGQRGSAICELTLKPDGQWRLRTANGEELSAALLPGCLVLAQLTVLAFRREDGKRASAVLLPSNTEADAFRRLRVRLRWQAGARADG